MTELKAQTGSEEFYDIKYERISVQNPNRVHEYGYTISIGTEAEANKFAKLLKKYGLVHDADFTTITTGTVRQGEILDENNKIIDIINKDQEPNNSSSYVFNIRLSGLKKLHENWVDLTIFDKKSRLVEILDKLNYKPDTQILTTVVEVMGGRTRS